MKKKYIDAILNSPHSIQLVAKNGNEIIGDISLHGVDKQRFRHRAEMGVSVKKKYWNKGIGSALLNMVIEFAKSADIEIVFLEVRRDNLRAIHLYEKFNFRKVGHFNRYIKIGNEYFDCDIMQLDL